MSHYTRVTKLMMIAAATLTNVTLPNGDKVAIVWEADDPKVEAYPPPTRVLLRPTPWA